ncbi:MAG: TylF/MycF/NovP-related O-methyltransferase, partial [Rhodovibrionaceae bacterium]|nr:TylF/MycF/NovP-related O-methyltransferase [Rhodovibrionaceae bacterium]
WYESTYQELKYLYPALSPRGVLLLDDYGSFQGAKKAVDSYIAENGLDLVLHRVDSTGRTAVKP